MKKSKISESQVVSAIKEHEEGKSAANICRALGVHQATFYNWKKKYSGMDTQELRRLKELEEENRRLKHMYAELALDNKILKDVKALPTQRHGCLCDRPASYQHQQGL